MSANSICHQQAGSSSTTISTAFGRINTHRIKNPRTGHQHLILICHWSGGGCVQTSLAGELMKLQRKSTREATINRKLNAAVFTASECFSLPVSLLLQLLRLHSRNLRWVRKWIQTRVLPKKSVLLGRTVAMTPIKQIPNMCMPVGINMFVFKVPHSSLLWTLDTDLQGLHFRGIKFQFNLRYIFFGALTQSSHFDGNESKNDFHLELERLWNYLHLMSVIACRLKICRQFLQLSNYRVHKLSQRDNFDSSR